MTKKEASKPCKCCKPEMTNHSDLTLNCMKCGTDFCRNREDIDPTRFSQRGDEYCVWCIEEASLKGEDILQDAPTKKNPSSQKVIQIMVPPHITRRAELLASQHCEQEGLDPRSVKGQALMEKYQHDFCLQWTESQSPDLDEDLAIIERANPHTPHTALSIRDHFPKLYGPSGLIQKMGQGDSKKLAEVERRITSPIQSLANVYLEQVARKKRQAKAYPAGASDQDRRKTDIERYLSLTITAAITEGLANALTQLPTDFSELVKREAEAIKKYSPTPRSLNPKKIFQEIFGPQGLVEHISKDPSKKESLSNSFSSYLQALANIYVSFITRRELKSKPLPVGASDQVLSKKKQDDMATNQVIRAMLPPLLEVFAVKPDKLEGYVAQATKGKEAAELNTKEFRSRYLKTLTQKMRS